MRRLLRVTICYGCIIVTVVCNRWLQFTTIIVTPAILVEITIESLVADGYGGFLF